MGSGQCCTGLTCTTDGECVTAECSEVGWDCLWVECCPGLECELTGFYCFDPEDGSSSTTTASTSSGG